ncbi:hypothetical protein RchiOBHm_Chr2g0145761 [Rosa chinensis]|uniref:Uncharacterized protein n=1 Tax=Rosa chinensis TaxID=74649 RepID=A0A2P6RYP8_ROSCH|nr:hypothetical protein RchiOBHm_Chr2g0145761 [Rosa chinensis]
MDLPSSVELVDPKLRSRDPPTGTFRNSFNFCLSRALRFWNQKKTFLSSICPYCFR